MPPKGFLKKAATNNYPSRISVRKPVSLMEAFITTLRRRMIFFLIILKNSQASIRIFLISLPRRRSTGNDCLCLFKLCPLLSGTGCGIYGKLLYSQNQSLNPLIRTERHYPIITVHNYLQKCIDAGIITLSDSLEHITTDIRMIVIGNVFEWCLKNGDADFEGNMRRCLENYLNGVF